MPLTAPDDDDNRDNDDIYFYYRRAYIKAAVSFLLIFIDLAFLVSNMFKIPHGGYWSIVIAMFPLAMSYFYTKGQRRLYKALRPLNRDAFLIGFNQIYEGLCKISGTALFFAKDDKGDSPYIVHTMFKNHIIYEDNVIVSITRTDEPYGLNFYFKGRLRRGLRSFEIQSGYMEVVDVEEILKTSSINEKTIFYGLEEIATENPVWKVFL